MKPGKKIITKAFLYVTASLMILTIFINISTGQVTDPMHAFRQNEQLGRGGNIGNILYKWENWDKDWERKEMDIMKEAGLTGIRINTRPFLHMNRDQQYALTRNEAHGYGVDLLLAVKPPYQISGVFFERLDWTVMEALDRGFAVIIDNHQYRVMGADPMGLREMFLASWVQMAEHYKDFPDNVYFGLLNEPNNNLTPYLWNYLMLDAYRIVRESNPDRTLVIGPGNWNGFSALEELKLPEKDRNIIVEVHYYSPHKFTHQGVSGNPTGVTWRGTPEEKKAVEDDFQKAADWGEKHNRPLFLGEFGVIHEADQESAVKWLTFVVEQMKKHGMSWSMWDLMGSNMGVFDQENRRWINHRKDAILPP
ncbi:MAG: glycoside hydrolase family 5 protein [Cyclobacteriaceae bacterium]|nr:glycoside hydrolase family 5 protein [Cyclobacteriaceae bacterium]